MNAKIEIDKWTYFLLEADIPVRRCEFIAKQLANKDITVTGLKLYYDQSEEAAQDYLKKAYDQLVIDQEDQENNEQLKKLFWRNVFLFLITEKIYTYDPEIESSGTSIQHFQRYSDIGIEFKRAPTAHHIKIRDMITQIGQTDPNRRMPFVFVCSSSGTGKTQLPFSLDIPMLYFTTKEATLNSQAQDIYKSFQEPSKHLYSALEADIKSFNSEFGQRKPNERPSHSMEEINALHMEKHLYQTCGFLVKLLHLVDVAVATTPQGEYKNWLRAEIMCPKFSYQALTIRDAEKKLSEMFPNNKPAVFLDELVQFVQDDSPHGNLFRFFRSLVRSLRLVLIFMGTNVRAVDFNQVKMFESSRENTILCCHFVHTLPPICFKVMDEKRDSISKLSKQAGLERKLKGFIDFVFEALKNERPWFVYEACSKLELLIQQKKVDSLTKLLENLLEALFVLFKTHKPIGDDFYKGQIDFMDLRPTESKSVSFIDRHLAYFDSQNNKKASLEVYYNRPSFMYDADLQEANQPQFMNLMSTNGSGFYLMQMKSVMPRFDKEPLTGLCFSGCYPLLPEFLCRPGLGKDEKNARGSCLEMYYELYKPMYRQNITSNARRDGIYLEKLASMALILASHAVGLGNILNFQTFFEQFIRESQDLYEPKPVVTCENKLWTRFSNIRIPYCGTISSQWNEKAYKYLTSLGCLLGTVHEREAQNAVDVLMYSGNTLSKPIVSVECRLDRDSVDFSELSQKLSTLTSRPSGKRRYNASTTQAPSSIPLINIVYVRRLANMKDYDMVVPLLEQHGIWLVKLTKTNVSYEIISIHEPKAATKIYIMMDLDSTAPIHSEKLRALHEDFIQPDEVNEDLHRHAIQTTPTGPASKRSRIK